MPIKHPLRDQDDQANRILQTTLAAVRHERRRRRRSLATLGPLTLVLATALVTLHAYRPESPETASPQPPLPEVQEEPGALAVLVMRDGFPTLEVVPTAALADLELSFSLDPIMIDASFSDAQQPIRWLIPH